MYGPYLTMAEIKAKYPNQWVFLANPTATRHEVTGGHVILHAADRTEYYRLIREWDDPAVKELASQWTGAIDGELWELSPAAEVEPGAA